MRDINAMYLDPDDPREPEDEPAASALTVYLGANLDSLPAPNGPPMAGWCPDHPGARLLPSRAMNGAVYCETCRKLYRAIPKWLAPMYDATSSLTTTASTGLHDMQSKLDDALRRVELIERDGPTRGAVDGMLSELNVLKRAYGEFEVQLVGVSDKVRAELEKVLDAVPDAFEMKTIVARLKGLEHEVANISKRHASEDAARDRKPVVVGAVAGVVGCFSRQRSSGSN